MNDAEEKYVIVPNTLFAPGLRSKFNAVFIQKSQSRLEPATGAMFRQLIRAPVIAADLIYRATRKILETPKNTNSAPRMANREGSG